MDASADGPSSHEEDGIYVALTHDHLDMRQITDKVRSPAAGAIVLFAGLSLPSVPFLSSFHFQLAN